MEARGQFHAPGVYCMIDFDGKFGAGENLRGSGFQVPRTERLL
jgi:hypothetical protein